MHVSLQCRLVVCVCVSEPSVCRPVCRGACVHMQAWEVYIRSIGIWRQTLRQVCANIRSVVLVGHPSTPC